MTNPFKTFSNLHRVEFQTEKQKYPLIELELETLDFVLTRENEIDSQYDNISIYCESSRLDFLKEILHKYEIKYLNEIEIENKDWISEIQNSYSPFRIGKFYVSPSEENLDEEILLKIIPNTAFGNGEHPTTKGCLQMISDLSINPKNILDIGTGTGILAIAAQKLFPESKLYSTEIDEGAIECAKENFDINNCNIEISKNYNLTKFNNNIDLIIANILLNPLLDMSADISNMICANGIVIISGINQNQRNHLIDHFKKVKLFFKEEIIIENWLCMKFIKME